MKIFFSKLRVVTISSILLTVPGGNLLAQAGDIKQVLILNTYDGSAAPFDKLTDTFKSELQEQFDESIAFHSMDLNDRWGDVEGRGDLIAQLLQKNYAGTSPDMVFALGIPAIWFWTVYRDSIATRAPMIALARDGTPVLKDLRSDDIARLTYFSFSEAVDDILRIKPDTSHVVVVLGGGTNERMIAAAAKKDLAAHSERLKIEFTNDMTLQELQTRLAGLSEESAVFFGIFGVDAAGVSLPRNSGLSITQSASAAPVFGTMDYELGEGVIGGRLIQTQQIAVDAAEAGVAILRGEPVRDARKVFELSTPVYDWRELNSWGIDIDRLPAGSQILHRPPSVWDRYSVWIILAISVLVAQGLLIVTLLAQSRRRQAAEMAQKKLSGQLIHAYEDERRSIARDLHDDLSHRLARLAIDAGLIGRDRDSEALDHELMNLREELAAISEEVHHISYRLHPSIVEDLGIYTALRTECERVQKYTDASIKVQIDEIPAGIPEDAALCAYRVIQEALNNAVRHAQADNIVILLEKDSQTLKLEVSDDGRGFNQAQEKSNGSIGLSSMRERIFMMNGTLSIRSMPGAGTTVSALVPLTGESK
jgi:signal transduction histidine kinase